MNFLVFGAGAIGTYLGGFLARQGHKVVFLERSSAAEELQKRGLRLDMRAWAEGDVVTIPSSAFAVFTSPGEALNRASFDVALFAIKSFDTPAVLESLRPHAAQMPPVFCLSNGVDNEPALASLLGEERVIAGTVTSAVGRRAVGDVILERRRGVGLAAGHPLSTRLMTVLRQAGIEVRLYSNAGAMKWSKMLTNLLANATSAILNMRPAEIFAHKGLYHLEMAMLREALKVMKALGLPVVDLPRTPVRLLSWAVRLPASLSRPLMVRAVGGGRGGKMPSFHVDLHARRGHSEVEWLNGAVVCYGERLGVPTPVNRFLTDILMALTRQELPLETYQHQPEKLLASLSPYLP